MPPNWDRRRQGDGRERYPALRLYAKVINLTGFAGLVVGVVFAVLVLLFTEESLLERVAHSAMALGAAGAYFIVVRALPSPPPHRVDGRLDAPGSRAVSENFVA